MSERDVTGAVKGGRAARVWRRTQVGTALTVVLVLVLVGVGIDPSGLAALFVGTVLAVLGSLEITMMDRWRKRRLRVPLLAGVLLAACAAAILLGARPEALPTSFEWAVQSVGAVAAAALAGAVLGCAWPPGLASARGARRLVQAAGGALWIATPLTLAGPFERAHGAWALITVVALSKIGDICGYYAGNALGSTHPFPRISPGKTTAGCVASLVGGVVLGGLFVLGGVLDSPLGVVGGLLLAVCINLASQAGDLLESIVKRRAGVKDSGTWFGPSGGVLDLVDSLLVSLPVAFLSWPLLVA